MQLAGMDTIFLLAPTSVEERIAKIAELASGYVYYVSLKGVTGSAALDTDQVAKAMPEIKAHVKIPVGVGFGIRDAESAKAVSLVSDAVVIGSRIIEIIEKTQRETAVAEVKSFISDVRRALDGKNE
jgi:tryptophan synthase alpha chain